MRPSQTLLLAIAVSSSFATAPLLAQAPEPTEPGGKPRVIGDAQDDADRLHVKAQQAAAAGNYQEAYELLKQAFAKKQSYDIAANLGDAALEVKQYRDAAESLEFCIPRIPTGRTQLKATIEKKLERARAETGWARVRASVAKAELFVDGTPVGTSPLGHPIYRDPGKRVFEATLAGYRRARVERELVKGKEVVIELVLVRESGSNGPDSTRTRPSPARVPLIVTGSLLAAAGIGAGIGLTVVATSKGARVRELGDQLVADHGSTPCVTAPTDPRCAEAHDAFDARASARTGVYVSYAVGGAFAVATLIYGIVSRPRAQSTVSLQPILSPSHQGLQFGASF